MNQNNDPIPWRCDKSGSGHVLGYVRRNGSGIRSLTLLRQAIDLHADEPAVVDVLAIVEGGPVMEIRCSVCGQVRSWYPDQEQIDRLIKRMKSLRELA